MSTSQPGPKDQAHPAAWRQWLLPLGGTAVILTLLAAPWRTAQGMVLSYSQFLADVGVGGVRAVTIDPAGRVTGTLATGRPFSITIPVALDDRALAGRLAAHHVQVTATAAPPSPPLSALLGLLLEHETITGDQVRALVHSGAVAPATALPPSERSDR